MSGSGPVQGARRVGGLGDLAYQVAGLAPHAELFARKSAQDRWERVSASEFLGEVTALAKGLIAAGISAGDRVVVVCGTRYEFVLVSFAAWAVRAVVVPMPSGCSEARLRHVLRDCRPAAVVLEDGRHARTVAGLQHELTELGRTWRLDAGLDGISRSGSYMDASAIRFRREETTRDEPAVILYPVRRVVATHGVVLTHGNLLASGEGLVERLRPAVADVPDGQLTTVMSVPLADIHGLAALVACVLGRVRVGFPSRTAPVLWETRLFRPTVLLAGPALLEEAHRGERARASEVGWDNLNTFEAATDLAVSFDEAPRRKGAWKRMSRLMYDWVYTRIRDVLGGRVRVAVCAGAPLSERMDRFFSGAGVPVFQAFGTPETGGAFVASGPGVRGAGTSGAPLPETEVRAGADGEVYVRGPGVCAGYWDSSAASAAAFTDGWLATGVRGEVDEGGFLLVRGWVRPQASRLAPAGASLGAGPAALPAGPADGGQPAVEESSRAGHVVALEERLREHSLVSQVMVVVEGRPYASALLTLSPEQVEYWRLVSGRPLSTPAAEITSDPDLLREVQQVVHEANGVVPPEVRVRAFHVLAEEFTVKSGLALPSGELRRELILRAFAEEIDSLYQVPESGRG